MDNLIEQMNGFAKRAAEYIEKASRAIESGDHVAAEFYLHNAGQNLARYNQLKEFFKDVEK